MLPEARHLVLPKGIVSTGWPSVRETSRHIGLAYDDWQADLNKALLSKTKSGMYAADTAVLSICRQAGKTWDIGGLVFADSIIHPGTTTVWTAHRFKVSRETFNQLCSWARSPLLFPHIDFDAITTGAGNETIPFRNGSRIVFAARERGAIRGFTKVRRLILDEAQILSDAALSDLAPTMNQAENPQIILMGTPPKPSDPGEVFRRLRTDALRGDSEDVLFVEFSAEENAEIDDQKQWAIANPSYPKRTGTKAIKRLRRLLSDDDFRREALGIWDSTGAKDAFGPGLWEKCWGPKPDGLEVSGLAIAVSMDLSRSAIVAAGFEDEFTHIKPLQHGPGMGWVVNRAVQVQRMYKIPFAIDGRGPAAMLIPHLERAGVKLYIVKTGDALDAYANMMTIVRDALLRHDNYPELNAAVSVAVERKVGDRSAWGRRASEDDISTLEAGTLAAWSAGNPAESKEFNIW